MKFLSLILFLILITPCFAETLVKYNKQTGNIIQTNSGVDKIPSQDILNDRFISATTDVIFIKENVDIDKKRVDVNEKKIIDIPQAELDAKKQKADQDKAKKDQDRISVENKLKALGLTKEEIDILTQ